MPQKKHLPSVSDKEQWMHEHIKESELDQGRSPKRAKAIAAATVERLRLELEGGVADLNCVPPEAAQGRMIAGI
jgi:hypothetical protein